MKLCQLAEPIRIARDNLRRTQFHMRSEEASATSMITPIVVSRILFGSQIHQIIPDPETDYAWAQSRSPMDMIFQGC